MTGRRILLIEDNPDDVRFIQRAFRGSEIVYQIDTMSDGESAAAWIEQMTPERGHERPDLIVLDLGLPRMDGFQVLDALRANPVTRRVPVVVLTSSDRPEDIERVYDLGGNSYLQKPGGFHALKALTREIERYWFEANVLPDAA